MILVPFRLSIPSNASLLSVLKNCPMWGADPSFICPIPSCGSSPTHPPLFHPPSFVLPTFVWFYIFFSSGQVLLPALSWSSARSSVSGGVFLMYTWREMHSMSTYSSAILYLSCCCCWYWAAWNCIYWRLISHWLLPLQIFSPIMWIVFFIILFFNFTILYWFCHISTWIHRRYTCVPHPDPCFHFLYSFLCCANLLW